MLFRTSMLTPIWANSNGPGVPCQFAGVNSDITPEYDNSLAYYVPSIPDGCPTAAAEPGAYHPSPYPCAYGHGWQVEYP
eukprot:CAMPEP_0181321170 /NCGR_PEP_ID=MMETSP1101-20121128/18526_1 /TAXON_ID=46948 /ORGANISM="Rhodomonas abbreviata, Strain Caron Lab Isolate" /LENGTH=78 /DNA_ID=CAMNT_0023428947 /DNA_START=161 /DNA_END=397 /DNA_ORIENTATION=-